jgi:hypothetical protein
MKISINKTKTNIMFISHEEQYNTIKLAGRAVEQVKLYKISWGSLLAAKVGLMKKLTTEFQ